MKKMEPNLRERALFLLSPKMANEAYKKRAAGQKTEARPGAGRGGRVMAATGYGNHGASQSLNSLVGWLVGGGSAEDDIDLHGATLRRRARDLYTSGGLARSGPNTLATNVVGWGIQPKPKIDGVLLGLSDEQRDEWERQALREFRLWADNPMCDAGRQQDFASIQQLAFKSMLISGDVFCLFGMKENKRTPYETILRLLEADRISTPDSSPGDSESKEAEGGGRIVDGVEISRDGEVTAYYITNRHPLMENSMTELTWERIEAIGSKTGYPNALHLMTFERPEQRRGVPFVAAQIEKIKQLDRYLNSELAANVVSSMLTAFLESSEDDGDTGLENVVNEDERVTSDELSFELGPGVVYDLPPGKKVTSINPIRNNSAFDGFVSTFFTVIGASMEIPKEVLVKKYESNYTAARAALLDFWKMVRVYRSSFSKSFCQPIWELWLSEAVAKGRIEAPGFFDDPAIRQAWCGCMWMGAAMGHVDPIKEVKAARERVALNISTEEQEAAEYNGNDWADVVRQRKKELAEFAGSEGEEQDTGKEKPKAFTGALRALVREAVAEAFMEEGLEDGR